MELQKEITVDLRKAIKHAERVYWLASEETASATLHLVKSIKEGGFTAESQQTYSFPCTFFPYHREENGNHWHKAYFSLTTGKFGSGTWQAIYEILLPRDEISFRVTYGNYSENMKKFGLVCDALQMTIKRKGKVIVENWTVVEETGLDNSARAVKVDKPKAEQYTLTATENESQLTA